ncbi:MAG TPA: alpha/beta hydrolase [Anaerolineales bacterium]|nr:alpha/beta hydrolase [Anaerolineales bacterium]
MKGFDLGGDGIPLHFLHANGYPPDCYRPLFELLKTEYRVFGMHLRPLWENAKPDEIKNWQPFSEDLIRFLADREAGTVIGAGHSIGATVTLRTALRDAGKFWALILIDPVLFIPRSMMIWRIIRTLGLGDRLHPLIAGAERRRRTFDDLETLFKGYRRRHVFRYMSDESLWAFVEGITTSSANGGYELVYPPEWEAQIYRTNMQDFDIWRDLPKLEVPTLFIRGMETNTFLESAAKLIKRKQSNVRVETLEKSTHLLPLERPKEVFEIMQSFLKEVL